MPAKENEMTLYLKILVTIASLLSYSVSQAQERDSELFQQILSKVSREGKVGIIVMLKQPISGENAPISGNTDDELQRKIKYVQRQFEQQLAPYRLSTPKNESARESRKIVMFSFTPSLALSVTREELLAIQRMEIVESIREDEFIRLKIDIR